MKMSPVLAKRASFHSEVIPIIEKARDESDWFMAIVFSAIQLERYGYFILKKHLESMEVQYEQKVLEFLPLSSIALFLVALGKITSPEYQTIIAVNHARNDFMHRRDVKQFAHGEQAKNQYTPLVNRTIKILTKKLGTW